MKSSAVVPRQCHSPADVWTVSPGWSSVRSSPQACGGRRTDAGIELLPLRERAYFRPVSRVPRIDVRGTAPKSRESMETPRLSPSTKTLPVGTVTGPK